MDAGKPSAEAARRLEPVLALLESSPASLSSVTEPGRARDVHVADSLSGLSVAELREATSIADIGSGAGFPGLALAAALPAARVDLIESVRRKADFISEAIAAAGLENARSVNARSEDWARDGGAEAYEAVTARAVADLVVLSELASPLLAPGGHLVAWKGERELERERALASVADRVGMTMVRVDAVRPYATSRERHLYVLAKPGATPPGLPRRPGMARKRPLA